ncbi:type IX secretion system anionic LPS delivery protein PorZ [Paludibacter jiangxiensis]|uniref:Por secretion system C-terminal sorting domain-containing protein n=1 Tax=Paludibacter jiangxiensis TaxID=681398 RepID=A0A171AKU5_9BACT|nr:two-component regulator propeller domain-containing protein [Paludibacter jiangxiensis]GAT63901.1 Por secretion system C-terminal sorting domain-containing protein [Paludibacter jiangxiensis]
MKKLSGDTFKIIALLCIVLVSNVIANSQTEMGKWCAYFAYNATNQLALTPQKVFAISSGALFSVNKADQSIEEYSKITGLSDNGINAIAYDKSHNQLLIVYSDANIDLYSEYGIANIPEFHDKLTSIDKTLNSISFNGDYAYLSCKFGILVVNLVKKEIADNYVIGSNGSNVSVLATAVFGGKIYALTASGLMQANAVDHNLANYQAWSNVSTIPTGTNNNLIAFSNALWLLQNGVVYKSVDGAVWDAVGSFSGIARMQTEGTKLYFISDATSTIYVYDENLTLSTLENLAPQMITYDPTLKKYWYVNGDSDGIVEADAAGVAANKFKPAGPFDNNAWKMTFAGDKLFVVPGGGWASQYKHPASVMMFENNEWSYISGTSIAAQTNVPTLPVYDFISIAVDPKDNTHFFTSSYGMGLYEFKDNKFYKWYNSKNNGIESIFPGQSLELYYQRLDGLAFDKAGNLWFTNSLVSNSIKYLTPAGIVKSYPFELISNKTNVQGILVDNLNSNRKWGNIARINQGVFVFDDNGTLDDTSDDKKAFYTSFFDQDGNAFASDYYRCLVQDKNNKIWIGTGKGPIVISNPDKAFSPNFTISRIKIPRNDGTNNADYLLGTEQVTSIVVDGANRKWIGTVTSGLYLVSEDGTATIAHFTAANSPLLSDNIISLELNQATGELFIGTDQGLISYQTDANKGSSVFDTMYAYPNPVRETYEGLITITGLITGSVVKITDVAGNLVYETTSNGGIATWNGKRAGGKRVSTGVYLVLAVSPDGSQSGMTKILVIQ